MAVVVAVSVVAVDLIRNGGCSSSVMNLELMPWKQQCRRDVNSQVLVC